MANANGKFPPSTINDGYNERGYLRGVPGLHPDIRFTFRPMPVLQRGKLMAAASQLNGQDDKIFLLQAEKIVKENYLLEWDIADSRGEVLPITAENLLKQKPRVFFSIVAIVLGSEASDVDDNPPHLANEIPKHVLNYAMESGAGEEADVKNSATG